MCYRIESLVSFKREKFREKAPKNVFHHLFEMWPYFLDFQKPKKKHKTPILGVEKKVSRSQEVPEQFAPPTRAQQTARTNGLEIRANCHSCEMKPNLQFLSCWLVHFYSTKSYMVFWLKKDLSSENFISLLFTIKKKTISLLNPAADCTSSLRILSTTLSAMLQMESWKI